MIQPYEGNLPYIFVSYAHRDSVEVLKIISRMQSEGYRIWYDDGIDPGTEWDEFIASKLNDSGYVLAFISQNYLLSENCKDELNYARDKGKRRLLIYLENVSLPEGMQMRLNRLQAVHKYTYTSDEIFYQKLMSATEIDIFLDVQHKSNIEDMRIVDEATSPIKCNVSMTVGTHDIHMEDGKIYPYEIGLFAINSTNHLYIETECKNAKIIAIRYLWGYDDIPPVNINNTNTIHIEIPEHSDGYRERLMLEVAAWTNEGHIVKTTKTYYIEYFISELSKQYEKDYEEIKLKRQKEKEEKQKKKKWFLGN